MKFDQYDSESSYRNALGMGYGVRAFFKQDMKIAGFMNYRNLLYF